MALPGADLHASRGRLAQAGFYGAAKSRTQLARERSGVHGHERSERDARQGRTLNRPLVERLMSAKTADPENVPSLQLTGGPGQ